METSIFLAKLLGFYMIAVGTGVLFNLRYYQGMMEEFAGRPVLLYLGGVMALLFGLLIVLFHNVWVFKWTLIITIFGWLGLIKGLWILIFPKSIGKVAAVFRDKPNALRIHICIVLILGIILAVMGCCM